MGEKGEVSFKKKLTVNRRPREEKEEDYADLHEQDKCFAHCFKDFTKGTRVCVVRGQRRWHPS